MKAILIFGVVFSSLMQSTAYALPTALPWGHSVMKVDKAWELGATGLGVKVCVIDGGVDKNHPFLLKNVAATFNATNDANPLPYPEFDEVSHGTQTGGEIVGDLPESNFKGVAPDAKLYAAKIYTKTSGKLGDPNFDVDFVNYFSKAADWCLTQKVDVVSIQSALDDMPIFRIYAEKFENAGIVWTASAGNDGQEVSGYFPGALPTVISVGSIGSTLERSKFSSYGDTLDVVAPGEKVLLACPNGSCYDSEMILKNGTQDIIIPNIAANQNAQLPRTTITAKVQFANLGKPEDFKTANFKNKIALVMRGEIFFSEKAKNAKDAGAIGLIAINHVDDPVTPSFGDHGLLGGLISKEDGAKLLEYMKLNEAIIQLNMNKAFFKDGDGTSFSAPNAAGVVALIKSANPDLTPAEVRDILFSTANKSTSTYDVKQFGNGIVDAEAAVKEALRRKSN